MSIFNLHSNVLADYRDFVRSFFSVADDRAREFIERELVAEARLWRVRGEFVIERPLSGDPAPLPPSPMPRKLLAHEKCDCIVGAPTGRTGHSPGNWRNPGSSRRESP